ncbi:MAG: hypothetical protein ACLUFV_02115 [Acutalibacteraceae bacterium]
MPNVFCHMDRLNTFGNAEDYCKLILTAKDRPLVDLEISSADAYPLYTYKIHGTNGTLKGTMAHIDWKYFKSEEAPAQKLIRETLTAGEEKLPAYCSETLKWYEESWDGDPQAPFIAAVEEYYTQIYRLFTRTGSMTSASSRCGSSWPSSKRRTDKTPRFTESKGPLPKKGSGPFSSAQAHLTLLQAPAAKGEAARRPAPEGRGAAGGPISVTQPIRQPKRQNTAGKA